jgi:hypothetical protein
MMSTDEREVWIRVYAAYIAYYGAQRYGGGHWHSLAPGATAAANEAVEEFNKRFDLPTSYREAAR